MSASCVILCPGQGAQAVGMGRKWSETSAAARETFRQADDTLGDRLGSPLSDLCFNGPAERLNQTDVSQPAIYACSVACHRALRERGELGPIVAAAGLSLGEYTALHLAGAFDFVTGLKLVAARGRLMQQAAEASHGSMVALIGADDGQAHMVCEKAMAGAGTDQALVCANFNAPGQIVLSGSVEACQRAAAIAEAMGLKAAPLTVAGAFHSPLMQPAADQMAQALADVGFHRPQTPVWSNVTARPHDPNNVELLKQRLVEQIVSPVRWSQSCQAMIAAHANAAQSLESAVGSAVGSDYHELAPGTILKGLMRRIDRTVKVTSHDEP